MADKNCSMCGGKGYYCEHSTVETCWCVEPTPKADEVSELKAEVVRLRTRLEISDKHPYDGIACRDETIKGLERLIQGRWRPEVERLEAENEVLRKQLEQMHPFKFAGQTEGPELKCAACGGYHYGLPPNMPCPKNAAIAYDAALEGGGR